MLALVRRIPSGRVATYGDIAERAGHPRAWRAVGTIMRTCRSPTVPCHRVVAAGGRLGGYSDALRKRELLQDEGIVVGRHTIRHFADVRWTLQSARDHSSGIIRRHAGSPGAQPSRYPVREEA